MFKKITYILLFIFLASCADPFDSVKRGLTGEKKSSSDEPIKRVFRRKIILVGPPASGKGEVSKRLTNKYKISHLSIGKILRTEASKDTKRGKEIEDLMDKGEMVPKKYTDEIISDIVERKCSRRQGFILDGFPRTVDQAEFLDKLLEKNNCKLSDVIVLSLPYKVAKERALSRNRKDDNVKTINSRIKNYEEHTLPVIEYYKKQGLLRKVDASQNIDNVADQVMKKVRRTSRLERESRSSK